MSKTLSKYFAVFNYVDKTLLVLSVTGDSVYIASFATFIVAPAGLTTQVLILWAFLSNKIITKIFKKLEKIKKKNETVSIARSKLNSIEKECLEH